MKIEYVIQEASLCPHGINYYDALELGVFKRLDHALRVLVKMEKAKSSFRYRLVKRVETIEKETAL
jgi:hypothetical protein